MRRNLCSVPGLATFHPKAACTDSTTSCPQARAGTHQCHRNVGRSPVQLCSLADKVWYKHWLLHRFQRARHSDTSACSNWSRIRVGAKVEYCISSCQRNQKVDQSRQGLMMDWSYDAFHLWIWRHQLHCHTLAICQIRLFPSPSE